MSTSKDGAWRSYDRQKALYNCYQCKVKGGKNCCNNGNLAAVPGSSNHGWGIASDLKYGTGDNASKVAATKWAHKNAKSYGLKYSVCKSYPNNCKEPWHIEAALQKVDNSVVKKCG